MKAGVIEKYLERYAEPEAQAAPDTDQRWSHVVCIPACDEADNLVDTLQTMAQARFADSALVIIVVNGRQSAEAHVHASNAQTLMQLGRYGARTDQSISWGMLNGMALLVVDRASTDRWLPPKQGVGLARKIAGDIALALIHRGVVQSDWIRCTDADVQVPKDYFEQLAKPIKGASAAVTPFVHVPEGDGIQQKAMGLYDAYLQAYVDGLARAGSPYAFHTIGSQISVSAQPYAIVRGIPKRLAAEDFYLLNKLAKVGRIHSLAGEPVRVRGRLSDRVPFGTGAALKEISAALRDGSPVRSYAPRVFEGVGHWLRALKAFADVPDVDRLKSRVQSVADPLGSALFDTLDTMGAFDAAAQASAQASGPFLHRRLMEWNDAFRTLKLVHGLRDAGIV